MANNDRDYIPVFDEETGVDIAYRDEMGTLRRISYEPTDNGHKRVEQRWTGAAWDVVDREPVNDLVVERPVGTD
ncbi:hypothetical protein ACFO5R_12650 [Halosolutus amylolyticus]|uniref:YD repeat-containing protein n=1 Tax=Halosolutus amylolyticus TaxID=2932267 RepID=A0ABD5PQK5_9EURY|nr:hypothetical protein [Halosolutus amylolyticus]